jgi:uncharacterized membrane protein (UPF0136 family)
LAVFAKLCLFLYGVALIAGGVMGYAKAQSLPSLIAGSASGILILVTFAVSLRRPRTAFLLALLIALGLGASQLLRYIEKGEAGAGNVPLMIACASGFMVVVLVLGLVSRRPKPR